MSNDAIKPEKKKRSFNKRKFKYGFVATVITLVFIAVVIVVNLIVGILTDRKNLKLDLTENQLFEVSQDSIDYVKSIKKDVEIAVMKNESYFTTGSTYTKMVLETLEKYKNCLLYTSPSPRD